MDEIFWLGRESSNSKAIVKAVDPVVSNSKIRLDFCILLTTLLREYILFRNLYVSELHVRGDRYLRGWRKCNDVFNKTLGRTPEKGRTCAENEESRRDFRILTGKPTERGD